MKSWKPRERRLQRRKKMILWTIVPALILIVLAVRLLLLPVHMGQAQDAHRGDDGGGMVSAGDKLGILNLVERWRAPFVTGTGRAMDGDLEGGRTDLETALARTKNDEDDCTVRTNLVLVVSQQADAAGEAGDADGEKALAEEGLALIEEGPEGCLDGSNDGNGGDAGRKQQDEQEKLQGQSGQEPEEEEGGEEEEEGGTEEEEEEQGGSEEEEQPEEGGSTEEETDPKQEELDRRNSEGQQEAEEDRRNGGGGQPPVEKPW